MISEFRILYSGFHFLKRHWRLALAVGAVALAFLVVFPYYAWKAAIQRDVRSGIDRGRLESEISNLKAQARLEEDRAIAAEGRAQELGEELEKKENINHQLSMTLEKLKAAAAAEKARIAALPAAEVAAEVAVRLLTDAPGSEATLRRTLEIIAERDSCRDQSGVKDLQHANCRESLVDYAGIGEQQGIQIRELKHALDLERRAFDKRDDLAKVQVKAAKGSWLGRTLGKAKWFVVGVGAGAVAGAIATR